MTTRLVAAVLLLAFSGAMHAQHQPYAGQHERELKALSVEEVNQYTAGAGMGYAKSAELNHFPGPMHVLELAEPLKLTAAQYRLSHLETHRRMRALLSDEQVMRYDELRGYASGKPQHHRH